MKILVISGKSASGKDTIAQMMREKLEANGKKCITIHYADLVKFFAKEFYNWDGNKDVAGRRLLQTLGTNKVRANDADYWVECVARFLAAISPSGDFDYAFIPDARFPNEIEVLKKYNDNVITIRINRIRTEDNLPYYNPALTIEQIKHPSETSLDHWNEFDYIVENRSLEELKESAEVILSDIGLFDEVMV